MSKHSALFLAENQNRMIRLNQVIDELFDQLAPDEVEILSQNFVRSTTRTITVIETRKRGSLVMDLKEEVEFKAVLFPEELHHLLRRNDVFLTSMGFRDERWHVLYMSPLYRS